MSQSADSMGFALLAHEAGFEKERTSLLAAFASIGAKTPRTVSPRARERVGRARGEDGAGKVDAVAVERADPHPCDASPSTRRVKRALFGLSVGAVSEESVSQVTR